MDYWIFYMVMNYPGELIVAIFTLLAIAIVALRTERKEK